MSREIRKTHFAVIGCAALCVAGWYQAWPDNSPAISGVKFHQPAQIEAVPGDIPQEVHIIEVPAGLPADALSESVCLIGSLGDAGVIYPITLETLPETSGDSSPSLIPFSSTNLKTQTVRRPVMLPQELPPPSDPIDRPLFEVRSPSARHRVFFLQTGRDADSEKSYEPVSTRVVAESVQISVWQDQEVVETLSFKALTTLVRDLEQEILPSLTALYGPIDDLDGDSKLAVCLTPRLAKFPATESAVEGLVQINDFQPTLPRPFSNQADVMFVSSALRPGPHLKDILAHEAAHLAVFSRRRAVDPLLRFPDDEWLNEGLAHFAEPVCAGGWSNLDRRLSAFAANSAMSPLLVTDAGRQGLWRHPGSRGASWLFLAWLAEEFGHDAIRQLALHPDTGCDKLEQVTGRSFSELFREWSVAVWDAAQGGQSENHKFASQGSVKRVSYADLKDSSSRFREGVQRAGKMRRIDLAKTSDQQSCELRGTSVLYCRCASASRMRISAPKACRLQITLVRETPSGLQITPIQ